jgi:hypothetical protein
MKEFLIRKRPPRRPFSVLVRYSAEKAGRAG